MIVPALLLGLFQSVAAQPEVFSFVREWAFEVHNVSTGLPTNFVKDIERGADGTIWFSTDFGLVRLEGKSMEIHREPFQSPLVKQVFKLPGDEYAVITPRDILKWDRNKPVSSAVRWLPAGNALSDTSLHAPGQMYMDREGVFWFSEPGGIARYDGVSIKRFSMPPESQPKSFYRGYQVLDLKDGSVLIAAQPGFFWRYTRSNKLLRPVQILGAPAVFSIDALHEHPSGRILIGGDGGIFELDIKPEFVRLIPVSVQRQTVCIASANSTSFWAGTKIDGAFLYNNQEGRWSKTDSIPPINRIKDLVPESDGTLWVASDEGVFYFYKKRFVPVPLPDEDTFVSSVENRSPSRFSVLVRNRIYDVSTHSDPVRVRQSHFFPEKPIVSGATSPNTLWTAFIDGSFKKLEDGKPPETGAFKLSVPAKRIEVGNQIWLIPENDLTILRRRLNGKIDSLMVSDHPQAQIVKTRLNKKNDHLLAAVSDSSIRLLEYGPDSVFPLQTFALEAPDPGGFFSVADIEWTENGMIWIATTQGICKMRALSDQLAPEWIHLEAGFPYQLVRDLFIDLEGKLWIAAEHGLFVYYDGALSRFDTSNGLLAEVVTSIDASDRGLIAGHPTGFSVLTGAVFFDRTRDVPHIRMIDEAPLSRFSKELRIKQGRPVRLNAVAGAYPASQVIIQYRFSEGDWQKVDPLGSFFSPNLKPGEHLLEIRAFRTGFEPGPIRSYVVHLVPQWYNTWPVYLSEAFLVLLFVFGGIRFRLAVAAQQVAMKKLEQTRNQIQTVVTNSPVLLFVIDQQGKIVLLEGKALESMHINPADWTGRPAVELFDDLLFLNCLDVALRGEESTLVVDRASRSYDIHLIPQRIDGGSAWQVNGIGVDVTEQISTERKLRLANEEAERARNAAENANRAKSQFLANMSHELRTPLNAIIGYAQVLDKDPSVTEKPRQYIRTMRESGFHLLSMINDILDLSKIESGQMELTKQPVNLRKLMQDMEDMFLLQAQANGLVFETRIDEKLPAFIETDANKLRQILINLISNAIKYTKNGFVRIVVAALKFDENNELTISVADSGRGIPFDQQDEVFKPFKQVQGAFNSGTGLGLTIVKNLVSVMGGRLELISEPGKGSVFQLYLPLQVSETSNPPQDVSQVELKKETPVHALIVDDVESNLNVLEQMLAPLGVLTRKAKSGSGALLILAEQQPDFVLLDLNMPGLSGEQVLDLIRSGISKTLPVIAVTAQGLTGQRERLLASGFNGYVSKPFLIDDLLEAIHVATSGRFTKKTSHGHPLHTGLADPETLKSWFVTLSQSHRDAWLEALELTDLETLAGLAQKDLAPAEMQHAINSKDYRYLFTADELLSEMSESS